MSITTVITQRSLARETWLAQIGEAIVVEHPDMVAAMRHLFDEIEKERPGNWTYHIYDSIGARYSLHDAYTNFFGVAPRSTPRGYRFPRIGRA